MNHSHDHMQWHNQQAWSSEPAGGDRLISSSGSGLFSSSDKQRNLCLLNRKPNYFITAKVLSLQILHIFTTFGLFLEKKLTSS